VRRPLLSIDRLSDRPVMFTVALLSAGGAVAAWSVLHQTHAGRLLAEGLAAFSVILLVWCFFSRAVDRSRRVKLDRAVDEEMGKKWGPGFARTVGVYEKPWYLLCGETGVGKTAALRAGRLPMAMGPDGQPITDASQGVNGTFMFDWWFFEDAVVLDSAGDLIANPDERWSAFLDRIHDARPARPINGMLLSISAEDLLGDVETVREKAELLARQVEVARQRLHVRFPLYLLVTKADLITGFSDYFPAGSDLKSSFQILGWSNPQDPRADDRPTPASAVRAGLEGVVTDLRRRRSLSMARTTTARPDADHRIDHLDEMFAFPAAVAGCLDNIEEFTARLLERSGTVAPPFLRGVYFTSALRTGDALDIELRNAFGVDQLPPTRRKPSDRAFFLRDLLLEKIVPEAGMVAPLQDVVSANAQRTRMVIGVSGLAAVAVIAVTVMGYRKTVGRVQADRDFWHKVETTDTPAALAVFGANGAYHGGDKLPSGKTVLATHEQAAGLSDTVTASSLLPLSAELDRDRHEAHADLFREDVLVPALLPSPPPAGVPAAQVALITKLLVDTQTPEPIPVEAVRTDAIALVNTGPTPPADRPRLLALLKSGVAERDDAGHAAATVRLSTSDRARIATAVAVWVEKYTDDRREAVRARLDQARTTLEQAHQLEEADAHFAAAFGPTGTSADQAAVVAALKSIPPSTEKTPVSVALVAAPTELEPLRRAVDEKMPMSDAGARIIRAVRGYAVYLTDAAGQWYEAATGLTQQNRPEDYRDRLAGEIDRVNRDDLSPVNGIPAAEARLDRDRAALATAAALADVKARFDKTTSPYPHPFFKLPAVLASIDSGITSAVKSIGSDADPSAAACRSLLDTAGRTARTAAWKTVLDDSTDIWQLTDPAGGTAHALDVSVVPQPSTDLFRHYRADPRATSTLQDWIATDLAVRTAPRPDDPAVLRSVDVWQSVVDNSLRNIASGYVAAWSAATSDQQTPNLTAWSDLAPRLGPGVDSQKLSAALNQLVAPQMQLIAVIDSAKQFPGLQERATVLRQKLTAPADAARVAAVTGVLRSAGFATSSAEDVRRKLLQTPAVLNREPFVPPSPAVVAVLSFRDQFWLSLFSRSIDLLVAERRPAAAAALVRIHDVAANAYPLVQSGNKPWSGDTAALRADLDLVRPVRTGNWAAEPASRVADLDVVTPGWAGYIDYLDRLCDRLDKPVTGSIKFEKDNARGNWSYVAVSAAGKPPGRPYMYDRAMKPTALDNADELRHGLAVQLLSSPDRPKVVAEITADDSLARPWSLIRLVAQPQPVRLTVASDEVSDKFYGILVSVKLAGFEDWSVPAAVPDAPVQRSISR
jgi:hypothetical protein